MTIHRGPPERIAAAHQAVLDWCAAHGRKVAGPRWEVAGDWREDPGEFETAVYWP